jgi:DnaJ-class molecular chaperone
MTRTINDGEVAVEPSVAAHAEFRIDCPTCKGTGTLYPPPLAGLDLTGGINCPKCDGTGKCTSGS